MKNEDEGNRLLKVLAIILGLLVLIAVFFLFKPNTIDVEVQEEGERSSIIDIPGLGEKSDPLEKKEADVDITVTPQYHGSFSLDKVKEWLEDPSDLIDNTSVSIEGSVKF